MTHTWKLLLAVLLIAGVAWSQANQILLGSPATMPTYYAAFYGVVGNNSTNDCTNLTAAMAAVSAVGPAYLQLPQGDLTLLSDCDLTIPGNVILKGTGMNGWNGGVLATPKSGLHLENSGSGPIITCLEQGVCGLQDMYVVNDANSRPFMEFTCSVPWLDNVMFKGEFSGTGSIGPPPQTCAGSTHVCPDNDGVYFGGHGDYMATCGTINANFSGYGSNRLRNIYFQNMKTWVTLNKAANGLNFDGLRGDFTDANPGGFAIQIGEGSPAVSTAPIYGNTFRGVSVEQAPYIDQSTCGYASVFGLDTHATNNYFMYEDSDVGSCVHSFTISDGTSSHNLITAMSGGVSGTPVSDSSLSSGNNTIIDNVNRVTYTQSLNAANIGSTSLPVNKIIFGSYSIVSPPTGAVTYEEAWFNNSYDGTCTYDLIHTGSFKVKCFYDGSAWVPIGYLSSPTFTSSALGNATATTVLSSGTIDGTMPVTIASGSTTLGATYKSGYTLNQGVSPAVTYTLPGGTLSLGQRYCIANSNSGSAASTSQLTLRASTGQKIVFTDGTLTSAGGGIQNGLSPAGNEICVLSIGTALWQVTGTPRGNWAPVP